MSETTNSPEPDDQPEGTFVGGSFGSPEDAARQEDPDHGSPRRSTTAQQLEAEEDSGALAAPPATEEFISAPSDEGQGGDVEGITAEPAPGDRNEPV